MISQTIIHLEFNKIMESLNEHIERMRSLIGSKHGDIKFLFEEEKPKQKDDSKSKEIEIQRKKEEEERQKETQRKKEEEANKKQIETPKDKENTDTIISIEDELKLLEYDYDLDLAESLDNFIEDTFFDDDINPLKRKIIDLIKSQEDF